MSSRPSGSDKAASVILVGLWTNVILAVLKLAAGLLGRSGALVADAAHTLTDFASDLVALMGVRLGARPEDGTHHYGHGKFETLSAAALGLILLVTGAGIFLFGVFKIAGLFSGRELYRPTWIAFIAAGLSVLVKEWLFFLTVRVGRRTGSRLLLANAWHHRTDSLSSIGAMFGVGGAIVLGERWLILDPLAALGVSFMVIRAALPIFRSSIEELLETSEGEETERMILELIRTHPAVDDTHRLRTRRVGRVTVVDVHIEVDKSMSVARAHEVTSDVEEKLRRAMGEETKITVHVEPSGYRDSGEGG